MTPFRRPNLVWIAAAFLVPSLWGQRYSFKFYGEEAGLQNLAVQAVLQDRTGFLWAGTQNGLYRYDGDRFIHYGIAEGLSGARIESLHESVDGTLWVGTGNGLARKVGDRFEPVGTAQARGIVGRQGISSDRQGSLFLATDHGLAVLPRGEQEASLIPSVTGAPEEANSVYVDGSGTVWYGCGDTGLCRLENGRPVEVGAASGLPKAKWDAILEDLDGNLWVRSQYLLAVRRAERLPSNFGPDCPHQPILIRFWPSTQEASS